MSRVYLVEHANSHEEYAAKVYNLLALNKHKLRADEQGINQVDSKRELCSESKKFKCKNIKKESSPFKKLGVGSAVGRNSSYYNKVNNPFTRNNINLKEKKKIVKISGGNEFRKSTQSFRIQKASIKSKNKIINNNLGNIFGESEIFSGLSNSHSVSDSIFPLLYFKTSKKFSELFLVDSGLFGLNDSTLTHFPSG